jgi:hypothetical protein
MDFSVHRLSGLAVRLPVPPRAHAPEVFWCRVRSDIGVIE